MTQLQRAKALAPSNGGAQQIANGRTGILEEDMVVVDLPGGLQARAQVKVSCQNGKRPRAEFDASIFAGLGLAPIDAMDSSLVDADNTMDEVEVRENEGNLLRGPQSREEPKLIVVALRLAPIAVNGGDQRLGIVHGKRVDLGSIGFPKTYAPQMSGGVFAKGPIPIAEVERALQRANGIVVCLLAPLVPIRDGDKMRVADLLKDKMTDL